MCDCLGYASNLLWSQVLIWDVRERRNVAITLDHPDFGGLLIAGEYSQGQADGINQNVGNVIIQRDHALEDLAAAKEEIARLQGENCDHLSKLMKVHWQAKGFGFGAGINEGSDFWKCSYFPSGVKKGHQWIIGIEQSGEGSSTSDSE